MSPDNNKDIDMKFNTIRGEAEKRRAAFRDAPVPKIHIGMATCGIASGALETQKAFEEALVENNIEAQHPYCRMHRPLLC